MFKLAVLFFTTVMLAFGQITGDLDIKISDKSDAAISGAQVTLTNTETGAARRGTTDTLGAVRFTLLNVGRYQVKVESTGFETTLTQTEVNSGAVKSVPVSLNVKTLNTEVMVEESTVWINTVSAQLQTTTDAKAIAELPLAGGILALAGTTPGVIPVTTRNPFLGLGSYNSNGGRGRGNNITIDSATATDVSTTGGAGLGTIPEYLIREVSIISNNFSAEFGRNANSQFQMITKSGTNELHGQGWWQFRNDKLNARDFFALTRPPVRDNRYGGYLGAPIVKNKLFVIGHYERQFIRGAGGTRSATTWTPADVAAITSAPSRQLFEQLKGPQFTSPTGTVLNPAPLGTDSTAGSIRMDWNINDKSTLFGRWAIQDIALRSPGLTFINSNLPTNGASSTNRPQNATLNYTRSVSPTLVWNFVGAFGRSKPVFTPLESFGGPQVNFSDGRATLGIWSGGPQGRVQNTYQYLNTVTWAKGKNLLKAGYEVNRVQANSFFDANVRGTWTFANFANFAAGTPVQYQQRFGNSVRGNRVWNNYAFLQDDLRLTRTLTLNLGVRLEINDGVTEVNGLISNQNLNGTTALGAAGTGALGSIDVGKKIINRLYNWAPRFGFAWNPNSGKTSIRGGYGWAYDYIFLNPITNVRFAPPFMYQLTNVTFAGNDSYANLVSGNSDFQRIGAATVGTFGTTLRNFGAYTAIDQSLRNPRVQQWNLTVEREFLNMLWRVGYVGTKSDHLQRTRPLNYLRPDLRFRANSPADEAALLANGTLASLNAGLNAGPTATIGNRIDPRFNNLGLVESSANSNYHGLQFWTQKRFARGLGFTLAYTWGKSIDDISDALGVLEADSANQQNPFNNRDNRAASAFDVTHRIVVTHNWELPWFRSSGPAAARWILGGWGVNGIWQAQTGSPMLLLSGPRVGFTQFPEPLFIGGSGALRPNLVGPLNIPLQPDPGTGVRNPNLVTNSGLAQPLLGNFGTVGRNVLRQNGLVQYDLNLQKDFRVSDRLKAQLQGQFLNLLNDMYFRAPGQSIFAPANFGYYQDTSNNTRAITLVLRFIF